MFARNLNPRRQQRVNSDAPASAIEEAAVEFARELTPIDPPIDRRNDAAGALALLSQQPQQESRRVSVGATPAVPPAASALAAPAPARANPLEDSTVDDIELVSEAIYVVTKNKPELTRIKTINGTPIQDIGPRRLSNQR